MWLFWPAIKSWKIKIKYLIKWFHQSCRINRPENQDLHPGIKIQIQTALFLILTLCFSSKSSHSSWGYLCSQSLNSSYCYYFIYSKFSVQVASSCFPSSVSQVYHILFAVLISLISSLTDHCIFSISYTDLLVFYGRLSIFLLSGCSVWFFRSWRC